MQHMLGKVLALKLAERKFNISLLQESNGRPRKDEANGWLISLGGSVFEIASLL